MFQAHGGATTRAPLVASPGGAVLGAFWAALGAFSIPSAKVVPGRPKTTPRRLHNLQKTPNDATLRFKRSDGGVAALLRCCLLLLPSVLASALASVSLFFH